MTGFAVPELLSGQFFYCLMVLALAGCAHGMFGVGFAMIATPLLALFVDYRLAILLTAVPLLCLSAFFLILNRRRVFRTTRIRLIVPGVALGSLIGAFMQTALPAYLALALLAVLLAVTAALPRYLHGRQVILPRTKQSSSLLGLCAGVTEAALNVGAPFVLLYGCVTRLNRIQQLLALNLCFAVGKSIQLSVLANAMPGLLPLPYVCCAVVVSLAGQAAGHHYAGRFSEESFRRYLSFFLYGMSVFLLCRAAIVVYG